MNKGSQAIVYFAWTITVFLNSSSFASNVSAPINGPSFKKYNFGIVVKNEDYSIYRSRALGEDGIEDLRKYLIYQNLPFPKTIISMHKNGYAFPFYFALGEYEASIDPSFPFRFIHAFGSERTYLDGYNPYYPSSNIDKKTNLGFKARKYFELEDDEIDGGIDTFFNILEHALDPENQPVLVHCHGGLHRTGMVSMAIRFIQDGFWVNGVKKEVKGMLLNPAQQEYAKYNPLLFREDNIAFIEQLSKDPRFLIIKERYHDLLQESRSLPLKPYSKDEEPEDDLSQTDDL